tara:strand:+ start:3355 stop:3558 length:204 start_codon:yes stop_codon:yes gene_type:complete
MNNADSFAMAFDECWKNSIHSFNKKDLNQEQKINLVLSEIKDHPFILENPSGAKDVAHFRIRLLNLN